MKLLITDDEYATRSSIKHLVDWDQAKIDTVLEADSFDEAVIKIIEEEPEIIITDIVMPAKNGIHLMEWILQHSPCSKVIAVSGHNDYEYIRPIMKNGGVDYLLKPLDIQELNDAVLKAVELYRQNENVRSMRSRMDKFCPQASKSCHPVMIEVIKYLEEHYCSQIKQQTIADHFFINREYLSRKFKEEVGESMIDFVNRLRINKAMGLLNESRVKISDVAFQVGFNDEKYFSRVFRKIAGVSPKGYVDSLATQ